MARSNRKHLTYKDGRCTFGVHTKMVGVHTKMVGVQTKMVGVHTKVVGVQTQMVAVWRLLFCFILTFARLAHFDNR
jgi:hypothetical protein